MNQDSFDPPITHFVIFSGGGGFIQRKTQATLKQGENLLQVKAVPASFDPETFLVTLQEGAQLKQTVIRKPNRKYVEDILQREGSAAKRLIEASSEVGPQRSKIIEICEDIAQRTYLDEEVDLHLRVESDSDCEQEIELSYFVDDTRFSWRPSLTVELSGDGEEVRLRGTIAITNESAHTLENVEVSFADFAKESHESASNYRAPPGEMRQRMRKAVMKKMMFK